MIDMRDLERWWGALAHTRQSLFILDACFSGLGLQSKNETLKQRSLEDLDHRGHHLITAGTANQESYASVNRWGGSLFTTALIDGMRGYADAATRDIPEDGVVSLKELWEYVQKRINSETPPNSMTPQLASFEFSSRGEFFFLAGQGPRTETQRSGEVEAYGDREAARGLDWSWIQSKLNALGYGAGKVDGMPGPRTRSALASFQRSQQLRDDGTANDETLSALRSAPSEVSRGSSRLRGSWVYLGVFSDSGWSNPGFEWPGWRNSVPVPGQVITARRVANVRRKHYYYDNGWVDTPIVGQLRPGESIVIGRILDVTAEIGQNGGFYWAQIE